MVCVRLVIGQQQQVDEEFSLSMGRDVQRNGLAFVECYHVDGNVFIQTFELGNILDGQWKRQTGSDEFGQKGPIMAHA